jgi:hypothetical protein
MAAASPMASEWAAARLLCRRQVGEIGAMFLAGVDDHQTRRTGGIEQASGRTDRTAQHADIVAPRLAEPAGLQKIALHVDDHERRYCRLKGEFVGLGVDLDRCLIRRGLQKQSATSERPRNGWRVSSC